MVADKSLGVGLRQSFGMLATSEPFEHRRAFLPGARLPIKRDGRAQEPAQLVLLVSRQRRQDAEKTFGEYWHSCARVWHIAVCLCQAKISNRVQQVMVLNPTWSRDRVLFLVTGSTRRL